MKFMQKITHSTYIIVFTLFAINSFASDSQKLSTEIAEFHKHADQTPTAAQRTTETNLVGDALAFLKPWGISRKTIYLAGTGLARDFICSRLAENATLPGTQLNGKIALGIALDVARIAAFYRYKFSELNERFVKKTAVCVAETCAQRGITCALTGAKYIIFDLLRDYKLESLPHPVEYPTDTYFVQGLKCLFSFKAQGYANVRISSLAKYVKKKVT